MFRTTHKVAATHSRRPIERLGLSAKIEAVAISLEATVAGSESTYVRERLQFAASVINSADTTGWFAEPLLPSMAVWLDNLVRSQVRQHGIWLLNVSVSTPDGRCEYAPD